MAAPLAARAQSTGTASSGSTSADAAVDRAVTAYAKITTLRATFRQRVTNPLTGSTASSEGVLEQRIPGYLSVRFTEPAGDRIVADGKWLWVYLPSTNPGQVYRSPLTAGSTNVPDPTSWFLDSPHTRYHIADGGAATVNGHATHAVLLVPRDSTLPFTRATVWVDDDDALIRQFETVDANGIDRRVTVTSITPNAAVDRKEFTFHVPKGAQVFDRAG